MKRIVTYLALAAVSLVAACVPVPNATKNGTLVKLEQRGILNKTWEAEIVRGGSFTGGTGVQGAAFDFTISDMTLLAKAQEAFENQQEVRITYHRAVPAFFASSSDGYFLDSIEVISADQGGTLRAADPLQPDNAATVVGVGTETIEAVLKQNQQALSQNERLLRVVEKSVGITPPTAPPSPGK